MSLALQEPLTPDYRKLAPAGLRTFFNIAEAWKLSLDEQLRLLGSIPRSTYYSWKKRRGEGANVSHDTLERISYLLGIYKALQILLPEATAANTWVRRPNHAPLFGGSTPLERMLSGNVADLFVVRQYLDGERGWN